MADFVNIEIDRQDLARIQTGIRSLIASGKRTASQAVTYAGLKIAESFRKASKPSRKLRDVRDNPAYREMERNRRRWRKKYGEAMNADEIFPYFMKVLRQGQEPTEVPLATKNDPRRTIHMRGVARKTWSIAVGKLGGFAPGGETDVVSDGNMARVARQRIRLNMMKGQLQTSLHIQNLLTYLEGAYPGITARAIHSGAKAFEYQARSKVGQAIKAAGLRAA